jgi:hypothetical protein
MELKGHLPFTVFGAVLGIAFMLLFRNAGHVRSHTLFVIFHPAHVVLSAVVTASMFKMHAAGRRFLLVLAVGYFGSIGVATLSDIVIPQIGSSVLGLDVPFHAEIHHAAEGVDPHEAGGGSAETDDRHGHGIHLGFIEDWYVVNPAAIAGVIIAWFGPRTKFPHAGHILISTWASSSYLLMNIAGPIGPAAAAGLFATLVVSTWLPCCVSDIVFPLLFVGSDVEMSAPCREHRRHSHEHLSRS